MKKYCSKTIFLIFTIALILLFPGMKAKASGEDDIVITIDAGHSESDSGAVGIYDGRVIRERDVNLKIARAMKAELETYKGVKVYLTRTDNTTAWTLAKRVDKAVEYHTDVLISLHNNAEGDAQPYTNGASVLISSGQYRPELAKLSEALGKLILQELQKATGVKNQGLNRRLLSSGYYPNGSYADYYQLIRNATISGIPSMIVEHSFIDNYGDYKKCLSSDKKIRSMGIADATAVAKYFGLTKKNGKTAYHAKGETVKYLNERWLVKGGKYYCIEPDGNYKKGWMKQGKDLYYFKKNGAARTGTMIVKKGAKKGTYYFRKNGTAVKGWTKIKGRLYHFENSGKATVGKRSLTRNGSRGIYYFSDRGRALTGWRNINGKYYYFRKSDCRAVRSCELYIKNKRYRFNSKGVCTNRK